jgi:cytidylate kinase
MLDGEEVDSVLDSRDVSIAISRVSEIAEIRSLWKRWLRSFAFDRGLVADGRSMGTEIFPEANIKFWLQAAMDIRARRRAVDYGVQCDGSIENELVVRDRKDREGTIARLVIPPDAVQIDSSEMTQQEVVEVMLDALSQRGLLDPERSDER